MANNTFTPTVSLGVVGGGIKVFLDNKCTQQATVFDLNGNALRGNALTAPDSGVPAAFQVATVTTVYMKHSSGQIAAVTSAGSTTVTKADGVTPTNANLVTTLEGI